MRGTKHAEVNKKYTPKNETIHLMYHAETSSLLNLRISLVFLNLKDRETLIHP